MFVSNDSHALFIKHAMKTSFLVSQSEGKSEREKNTYETKREVKPYLFRMRVDLKISNIV